MSNKIECKGGKHYQVTEFTVTPLKLIIIILTIIALFALGFLALRHYVAYLVTRIESARCVCA